LAKKSKIAKEKKRQALVEKYAELRKQLKEQGNYDELQKLPEILRLLACITAVR